ncbi:MAG: SDR family NAD(P)-dependent oxidoreductase [Evtepia gabavorous]
MLTGKTAVVTGGLGHRRGQCESWPQGQRGGGLCRQSLAENCARARRSGKAWPTAATWRILPAVKDLMAQIKKEFGTVDILVNNAG